MRRRHLVFLTIVALAAASLAVGTGADTVTYDDVDTLELQPAGDGAYVQENGDGEISVVVGGDGSSSAGVNDAAVTDLGAVFTVENLLQNGAESDVTLFIETLDDDGVIDGGEDSITFYDTDAGTDSEINADDGVHLTPGSDVSIGMRIDTTGSDDPEAVVAFRLMAQVDDDGVFETLSSSGSGSSSGSSSSDSGADDGVDEAAEEVPDPDDGTADPASEPTADTDDGSPASAVDNAGGDGETGDGETGGDDASGLIELAGFGSLGSLGAIGVAAATLSLTYAYRRRLATGVAEGR